MNEALFSLASIGATRPVFGIVMGVCLAIFAWRLARVSGPWAARLLMGGAVLLCLGYAVVQPLFAAGLIRPAPPAGGGASGFGNPLLWMVLRALLMNVGWLLFGLGMALHAGVLRLPRRVRSARTETLSPTPHESIA